MTHFHPSVSLLAASIFSDEKVMPKPDLESHSLIRFLDKFVYRNPKAAETNRGASIMQPVRNPDSGSIWLAKRTGTVTGSINTPNFWNKKVEQVAAEDIFFHEYFKQAGKKGDAGKKGAASSSAAVPDDQEENAEQEDEIWKALTASHPDGPIDISDEEDDLDMDGFDDSDDSDDGDDDGGVIFSEGSDELSGDESEGVDLGGDEDDEMEDLEDAGGDLEFSATPVQAEDDGEKDKKKAGRSAKRRLKNLPMFASADDYAELLAHDDD